MIVENEEQAKALNWPSSPTVRIKGLDIAPKAQENTSYAMTDAHVSRRSGTLQFRRQMIGTFVEAG